MTTTTVPKARTHGSDVALTFQDNEFSLTCAEQCDCSLEFIAQPVQLLVGEGFGPPAVSNVLGDHQERCEVVWKLSVCHAPMVR